MKRKLENDSRSMVTVPITIVNQNTPNSFAGLLNIYTWFSTMSPEECIYHCILREQKPIVVLLQVSEINYILGILKNLCDIGCCNTKQSIQSLKSSLDDNSVVLMPHNSLAVLNLPFEAKTVILSKNTIISNSIISYSAFKQSHFICLVNSLTSAVNFRPYECTKSIFPLIQSRVAASRKLFQSLSQPQTPDMIQRISALKIKLKVVLNQPCPALEVRSGGTEKEKKVAAQDITQGTSLCKKDKTMIQSKKYTEEIETKQTVRSKMEILGMINAPNKHTNRGRSLAQTQWMDRREGFYYGCTWKTIREGASSDVISRQAREEVKKWRDFMQNINSSVCKSKLICTANTFTDEWDNLNKTSKGGSSDNQIDTCLPCRVTAIGWRPNPYCGSERSGLGDDGRNGYGYGYGTKGGTWDESPPTEREEDWGGDYGKCCGHNEVVMHYMRPFFPMEVINTTVCSMTLPAPGNAGYHGCLEFLCSQCRWKKRYMTIWDIENFYFINKNGIAEITPKNMLLHWSLHSLVCIIPNLRHQTIQCKGTKSVRTLLAQILFLIQLATNKVTFGTLCNTFHTTHDVILKCQRKICSYLLIGSYSSILKASMHETLL